MDLSFPLELSKEAFLLELLEKSGVDEFFRLFGLYRRNPLRDFKDGVAHAFDIWIRAIVGHLHETLIGSLQEFPGPPFLGTW